MILYTPRLVAFRFLCWCAFNVAPRVMFKQSFASESYASNQWVLKHIPTKVGTPWTTTLSNHLRAFQKRIAEFAATAKSNSFAKSAMTAAWKVGKFFGKPVMLALIVLWIMAIPISR